MFNFSVTGSSKTKSDKRIEELEAEISKLKQENLEIRYMWLENLRTLRFSQKANERYKRRIKKLQAVFRQNGEHSEKVERIKPDGVKRKLPR